MVAVIYERGMAGCCEVTMSVACGHEEGGDSSCVDNVCL